MDISDIKCKRFEPSFSDKECRFYLNNNDEAGLPLCGFCSLPDMYRCTEDLRGPDRPLPFSHSSVQNYLSCHFLHYLKNIRGIETRPAHLSMALKLGTLWDRAKQMHLGAEINIQDVINKYEIPDMEVAKVKALFRAYKQFNMQVDPDYNLQAGFNMWLDFPFTWGDGRKVRMAVKGFYDRKYPTYFTEDKLTSRPEYYQDRFFIQSQVGTYFLADPNLEEVVMEITKTPDLKHTGSHAGESPDTYEERIFQDIMSRPSHYFIGFNRETRRYGQKFYRSEFQLDELNDRYLMIFKEMYDATTLNRFYKNDRCCKNLLPGIPCDMLDICRYNTMSEVVYKIRDKEVPF